MSSSYSCKSGSVMMTMMLCLILSTIMIVSGQDTPVQAPNFGFLPCSVCPLPGQIMTNPGDTVPVGTISFIDVDTSCISLELRGQTASFSPEQCAEIGLSDAATICGCEIVTIAPIATPTASVPTLTVTVPTPTVTVPTPTVTVPIPQITSSPVVGAPVTTTEAPVAVVPTTEAPVAAVPTTEAPVAAVPTTEAPVAAVPTTTEAPAVAPVAISPIFIPVPTPSEPTVPVAAPSSSTELATIYGEVLVQLENVASLMSPEVIIAYENQMSVIYNILLNQQGISNVTVKLVDQNLLRPNTVRHNIRGLQDTNATAFVPTQTLLNVTGLVSSDSSLIDANLNNNLTSLTNDNQDTIISGLQSIDGLTNQVYFSNVETMTATNPSIFAPTVPTAPTEIRPPNTPIQIPPSITAPSVPSTILPPSAPVARPNLPPNLQPPTSTEDDGLSTGAIVGIAIGSALGVLLIGGMAYMATKPKEEPIVPVKPVSTPGTRSATASGAGGGSVVAVAAIGKSMSASTSINVIVIPRSYYDQLYDNYRKVIAPAGKLGIVIDKASTGTYIKRMNDTSPLIDELYVGDQILEIDGNSTTPMTTESISSYMVQNVNNEREFYVCSPSEPSGPNLIRKVIAPPGPMGIVIDKNAIVVKKQETSPLKDLNINVGDQIIKVNDQEVDGMTSKSFTEYLSNNSDKERVLLVTKATVPSKSLTASTTESSMITVIAPAGKLGIVIERSTTIGSFIKSVKDDSPLKDQLYPNDQLISIDNQSTLAMTSSQIAEYLSKNSTNEQRIIVVKRMNTPVSSSINPSNAADAAAMKSVAQANNATSAPDATSAAANAAPAAAPGNDPNTAAIVGGVVGGMAAVGVLVKAASMYKKDGVEFKDYRTVVAPPGKLGIVIDKTPTGPIVKRVNETSPLYNELLVNDKIIKIDDNKTDGMTTDTISQYLMTNIDKERVFQVCTPMNMTRTVIAPAGKLGIVIDKHAIVQSIKDTSPLKDKLLVGDKILKIDNLDVDQMTASSFTEYIAKNADKERTLIVTQPIPQPIIMEYTIKAPSGKLGIVIDTKTENSEYPIIKRINDDSPLLNQLKINDQVIRIDKEKTEKMTSSMIATYLKDNQNNNERIIIVHRIMDDEAMQSLSTSATTAAPAAAGAVAAGAVVAGAIAAGAATEDEDATPTTDAADPAPTADAADAPTSADATNANDAAAAAQTAATTAAPAAATAAAQDQEQKKNAGAIAAGAILGTAAVAGAYMYATKKDDDEEKEEVAPEEEEPDVPVEAAEAEPDVPVDATPTDSPNVAAIAAPVAVGAAVVGTAAVVAASNDDDEDEIEMNADGSIVVIGPPGKLGLVIDKTPGGTIVQRLNTNSPLIGKIDVGDQILYIDDTDTKTMTAADITVYMMKTANAERKLTVLPKARQDK